MLSIFQAAARFPDRLAVCGPDGSLSFAQLARRVREVSALLLKRGGFEPGGAPLPIVVRPTLRSVVLVHACIARHVPFLPIHPRLPNNEREQLVARAGARAWIDADELDFASPGRDTPLPEPTPEEPELPLAYVTTSGSSGEPKIVVLTRRAFIAAADASAANLPLSPADRWLLCLPLSHVGGISIVTRCLLAGAAVALWQPAASGLLGDLAGLTQTLTSMRVSLLSLVPTILQALLEEQPEWQPSADLRAILLGGAATSSTLLQQTERRNIPILVSYGLTEACSQVATTKLGSRPHHQGQLVSCGRSLPGIELRVVAERIQIRGPTLCSAVLGRSGPLLEPDGWLTTEDRGFLDEHGELFVLGRATELIVSGGENVDPRRVERALLALPGVRDAAVFGVPEPRYGELVACALVVTEGFSSERAFAKLAEQLASYERPRRWAIVPRIPLNSSGKRDQNALQSLAIPNLRELRWSVRS